MSFDVSAADALPTATLHAAFTEAFADYLIGPFQLAVEQWPAFLARQAIDLRASRVALRDGRVLAFAFVAPRPSARRWRLATMGARPEARGSGAAPALLDDFVARARANGGLDAVELEVFAQNERAFRLYRGRGFEPVHALHGWRHVAAGGQAAADAPPAVARDDALAWLDASDAALPELPLQVTARVLGALPTPWAAWRHGGAQLVFAPADGGRTLHVLSLVDRDSAQRDAQALVQRLRTRHPLAAVAVPQLQRDDVGGDALQRLGFERQPLHQWWMRQRL